MTNETIKNVSLALGVLVIGLLTLWIYQLHNRKPDLRVILNKSNSAFKVVFLKDRPKFVDQMVENSYQRWSKYDKTLTREKLLEGYKKGLHDDRLPLTLVAVDHHNKLIGAIPLKDTVGATELKQLEAPHKAWLGTVYIDESMKKTQLRADLFNLIKELAKSLGYTEIWWYTSDLKNASWQIEEQQAEKIEERDFRDHTIAIMRVVLWPKEAELDNK